MITLNGVAYPAKEITFNDFCTFEEMGVDIQSIERKPLSFLRVYIALCMKTSLENAGDAMQKYIEDGGQMEDLLSAMSEAIENSGFFRTQQPTAEEALTESKKEK